MWAVGGLWFSGVEIDDNNSRDRAHEGGGSSVTLQSEETIWQEMLDSINMKIVNRTARGWVSTEEHRV